jgi:hypothetical protein
MRLGPGQPGIPGTASATDGDIPGNSSALSATARRVKLLESQVSRLREKLSAIQTESDDRRVRIAAIDAMLAEDAYVDCPPFLQEDSTVRALQKIICEAGSVTPYGEERLSTAAAVARERLRSKFQALRDQYSEEADNLDEQAGALNQRVHTEVIEVEHLQQVIREELEHTAASTTATSANE